jgi:hypothetical protein
MKLALRFFVFLALAVPAGARELADPSSGCSITIPDDWEIIPFHQDNGYAVASRSPDKQEGVSLFVTSTPARTIDEAQDYIAGFQAYLQQQEKQTIVKTGRQMVGPNPFYVITSTVRSSASDQEITTTAWITVANGKVFQIRLTDLDPAKAGEVKAALESFALK